MNEYQLPLISQWRVLVPSVGMISFVLPIQFSQKPNVYSMEFFFVCYQNSPRVVPFFKELFCKLCAKWAEENDKPVYTLNAIGDLEEQDFLFSDQEAENAFFTIETFINVYYLYYQNKNCALFKAVNHPMESPRN